MGVAADEQMRRPGEELVADLRVVMTRITSDVGDPDVGLFAEKALVAGITDPELLTVDVSEDRPQGPESLQKIGRSHITDVTGMPDLITGFEKSKKSFGNRPMGIGKQANAFHVRCNLRRILIPP